MEITAALAAALAALSAALDEPGTDIAETLRQLVCDARAAVPSYLGLTVAATALSFSTMDKLAEQAEIRSSLMISTSRLNLDAAGSRVVVILYAATPGAFVDLAADLAWLTGLAIDDFALDRHLHLPAEPHADENRRRVSLIDQAIGVLIGRGATPEQAVRELDARAAAAGRSRYAAAQLILNRLSSSDANPTPDCG